MGANNSDSKNDSSVFGYAQTIGANKFYELRFGYNKYFTHQYAEDAGIDENNQLGIPNGNLPAFPETFGIASFRPSAVGVLEHRLTRFDECGPRRPAVPADQQFLLAQREAFVQ